MWGLWLHRRKKLATSRRFLWAAQWMVILPFLMNTAGWLLTESGRQPWIVQGIMLTKNGLSPSVSTAELWISVIAFVLLYGTLGTVDLLLMLRYSRKELPPVPADGGRRTRSRDGVLRPPMAFVPFWFILITILWTGFFVLEGFDMGVGMLHGVIGKDEAGADGSRYDRPAVGRERGLADRRGRRHVRRVPRLVRHLVLGLLPGHRPAAVALIVRGVSFEYRGKSPARRWRRTWSRLLTVRACLRRW